MFLHSHLWEIGHIYNCRNSSSLAISLPQQSYFCEKLSYHIFVKNSAIIFLWKTQLSYFCEKLSYHIFVKNSAIIFLCIFHHECSPKMFFIFLLPKKVLNAKFLTDSIPKLQVTQHYFFAKKAPQRIERSQNPNSIVFVEECFTFYNNSAERKIYYYKITLMIWNSLHVFPFSWVEDPIVMENFGFNFRPKQLQASSQYWRIYS